MTTLHVFLIFLFVFTTVVFIVLTMRYKILYQDSLETIREMKKEPSKLRIVKGKSSDRYYIKFGHKFLHNRDGTTYLFYSNKTGCKVFRSLEGAETEFEKVIEYFNESYDDVIIDHVTKI